jgi:hypothetical protein
MSDNKDKNRTASKKAKSTNSKPTTKTARSSKPKTTSKPKSVRKPKSTASKPRAATRKPRRQRGGIEMPNMPTRLPLPPFFRGGAGDPNGFYIPMKDITNLRDLAYDQQYKYAEVESLSRVPQSNFAL